MVLHARRSRRCAYPRGAATRSAMERISRLAADRHKQRFGTRSDDAWKHLGGELGQSLARSDARPTATAEPHPVHAARVRVERRQGHAGMNDLDARRVDGGRRRILVRARLRESFIPG